MFEILSINKQSVGKCISHLKDYLDGPMSGAEQVFVNLGGLKVVKIIVCDRDALALMKRELGWITTEPVSEPDATIVLWREGSPESFFSRAFGLNLPPLKEEKEESVLFLKDGNEMTPLAQIDLRDHTVQLADGNTYYYGADCFNPESWLLRQGHLFYQIFYHIVSGPCSSLVHGACVGVGGKGVLVCARGGRGKSTLTVSALLKGFEYVADDYLILERRGGQLCASPIYSTVALSPKMYNTLYDDMEKARFVGIGNAKGKFVFDMAKYGSQMRRQYPILAGIFPEIDLNADEPSIERCSDMEKRRAITHISHSTVSQMYKYGLKQGQKDSVAIVKLINMLKDVEYYKMILCQDIFRNEEFLRSFVASLS